MRQKVIIMGAAGREFQNFNTFFRDNNQYDVVAITATQIPGIDDKKSANPSFHLLNTFLLLS